MNHCAIRRLRVRSGKCSSPGAISCRGDRSRSGGGDLETDHEATGHLGSPLGALMRWRRGRKCSRTWCRSPPTGHRRNGGSAQPRRSQPRRPTRSRRQRRSPARSVGLPSPIPWTYQGQPTRGCRIRAVWSLRSRWARRRLLGARSGNPAIRCPRLITGTGAEGLVLQRDS